MTYKLVQHIPSGETFAVRFDDDGSIYLSNALHYSETEFELDEYEYNVPAGDQSASYNAQEWRVIRSA